MPTQTLDPTLQEWLQGRYIATLGTENADGTIHLTAVWYLFEDGHFFIATSSKSRKARNIAARAKASLMVDVRKPGAERGVNGAGKAELVSGEQSGKINRRIHSRYMGAQQQWPIPTSGLCLQRLTMSLYESHAVRGSAGTWQCWTPKPLGDDWAERPGYLLPLD